MSWAGSWRGPCLARPWVPLVLFLGATALAQAADTGHGDGANADAITDLGERAKRNVELDRVEAAREAGYAVESLRLIRAPDAPPNKSDLLVGVPAGRAGALERLRVP